MARSNYQPPEEDTTFQTPPATTIKTKSFRDSPPLKESAAKRIGELVKIVDISEDIDSDSGNIGDYDSPLKDKGKKSVRGPE